jgi:hypothetical protein
MARKRAQAGAAKAKKGAAGKPPSAITDRHAMAAAFRMESAKNLSATGAIPQDTMIDRTYGIPLVGNLPMQYLLGVDVVPMERTMALVGKEGSLKSVMSWYFGALFLRYQYAGMVFFVDAEHKTNDDQIRGVLQNDNLLEFVFPVAVHNLSELCEALMVYSQQYNALVPASDIPCCYIVDSIGAVTSKAAQEAMDKTGNASNAAGYDAARRAMMLTEQFRAWVPTYLSGRPMTLVYINHLKEKMGIDDSGKTKGGGRPSYMPPEKTSPGGVHKDYLNTATIEMIKQSTPPVKSEMRAVVTMKTLKASLTETGRRIEVMMRTIGPMNMRYPEGDTLGALEAEDDVQRIFVYFDWDSALVEILTRDKGATFEKAALDNVLTITGSGNQLGCKRLGLQLVSKQELGAAIHADAAVVKELQDVLGIFRKRAYLPPGVSRENVPGAGKARPATAEGQGILDPE